MRGPITRALRQAVERYPGTMADLARRAGVHKSTLSRFLGQGTRGLTLAVADRLARALGMELVARRQRARKGG